jgi:hypothetical protein
MSLSSLAVGSPEADTRAPQKVATAKPCYICRRPTRTVLATLKTDDFVYTCDAHLTDTSAFPHPPAAFAHVLM